MARLERMFARTSGIVETLSSALDLEVHEYQVEAAQQVRAFGGGGGGKGVESERGRGKHAQKCTRMTVS